MSLRLSILITDEVSEDFVYAPDAVKEWDLQGVALRTLWGRNVVDLTREEVDGARKALAYRGLVVECIASPVFKSPLREEAPRPIPPGFRAAPTPAQLEVLERGLAVGRALGAGIIRVFSFWRQPLSDEERAEMASFLRQAARLAAAGGGVRAGRRE